MVVDLAIVQAIYLLGVQSFLECGSWINIAKSDVASLSDIYVQRMNAMARVDIEVFGVLCPIEDVQGDELL